MISRLRDLWTRVSERTRRIRGLFEIELSTSIGFPVVELVFAVLFFLAFTAAQLLINKAIHFQIGVGDGVPSSQIEYFIESEGKDLIALMISIYTGLLILVPMVTAYVMTKGFSRGSIKTLLSYPVTRTHIYLIRLISLIVLFLVSIFLVYIGVSMIVNPMQNGFDLILPMITAVFVSTVMMMSVTTFFSIIIKNSLGAGAVGTCFALYLNMAVYVDTRQSEFVRCLTNPVFELAGYLVDDFASLELTLLNTALLIMIGLSIMLIVLSWKVFNMIEVR